MSIKLSKCKSELSSEKEKKKKRMVMRYGSGSNSLQKGLYTTKNDLEKRKSKAIAYSF